jgi:hypothetical protein
MINKNKLDQLFEQLQRQEKICTVITSMIDANGPDGRMDNRIEILKTAEDIGTETSLAHLLAMESFGRGFMAVEDIDYYR